MTIGKYKLRVLMAHLTQTRKLSKKGSYQATENEQHQTIKIPVDEFKNRER